jgi:menaquinone-dependent protoporphyrinogen oxidase
MKSAIFYATNHGTTAKVAKKIQIGIGIENTELFNLKYIKKIDLSQYDKILIGGSIHAGSIQKRVSRFCKEHTFELVQKPLGLFLCCMDKEQASLEFDSVYPELLRNHAKSKKIMGGEFLFDKMNFIEKFLIKKISGVTSTKLMIEEGKIAEMVEEMRS